MDELQPQTPPQDVPAPPEAVAMEVRESAPASWRLRDLFLFLAFVPIGFLAANILAGLGYALILPAFHWQLNREKLATDPFFLLSLQTFFYGLLLAYVYVLIAVGHAQPFWAMLRWRRITAGRMLACLAGGAFLTLAIALLPPILPDTNQFPLENMFNSRAAAYAIGVFAIVVAPFMEELVFRGVLFGIFESQVGLRFAVVTTAILFGGLHVPEYWGAWNHMLLIFFVGLVFSLARGRSGSLAPSVFLHVGYNGSMMIALFLSTQHFRNLNAFYGP
ncbi:MAG: type II CAAX endopeptidase family protein [Terriglobia bacterium]|jgi:membrane protease YdiL (CAAX protease family)